MAQILDVIDDYSPAEGNTNIPLKTTVQVLFDRAMDETTLSGEFFLEGPDTDTFLGPGFEQLEFPDNVSEGDDFLTSPGFKGIVDGTVKFKRVSLTDPTLEITTVPYRSLMYFEAEHPFAALTQYTAHLPEAKDATGIIHSGYYTFSWTTGTGSIQALPSSISTSILNTAIQATVVDAGIPLAVVSTTPKDKDIQQPTSLAEIVIEFNKPLDPVSVTQDNVKVETIPLTDHPAATAVALGDLAKSLVVEGKKLIIKI